MHQSLRLGMIAPSSNTGLEPMTAALLAQAPWITAHSARIRVTSISMGSGSLAQFDGEPMLEAARLLAEAKVGSICWNGTAAGWLGHERDRHMTAAITPATGAPATSAQLAKLDPDPQSVVSGTRG